MQFLDGYKTHIAAALLIVLGVLNVLGYVTDDIRDAILPLLLGGGLAALRDGVAKSKG